MEAGSDKMYLQNIEEFVFDENKIVTYKWLGKSLSIHINAAKHLLDTFIKLQKAKTPDVTIVVTYYVSGILHNDHGMISSVVSEGDLSAFKDKLKIILSEHVYSIHKCSSSIDKNALYLADEHEDACIGAITNVKITKRTLDELSNLRLGAYSKSLCVKISTPQNQVKHAAKDQLSNKITTKDQSDNVVSVKSEVKKETDKTNSVKSGDKPKQTSKGISGFFSKQMNSESKVKNNTEIAKKITNEEISAVKTNGIKTEVSPVKSPPKTKDIKAEKVSRKQSNNKLNNSQSNNKLNNSQSNNKLYNSQSNKNSSKKRKRIQVVDSDSDEEANIDDIFAPSSPEVLQSPLISDSEDVIPPTPELSKPLKEKAAPLNSRKRKKTVDKTFLDEGGYFITKKEVVFESCSENEDEEESRATKKSSVVENVKTEPKTVTASNKNTSPDGKSKQKKKSPTQPQGKQQTLMNFFKKAAK